MVTYNHANRSTELTATWDWPLAQSDEQLAEKVHLGDRDAFAELINRHHATCVSVAASILPDRADVQDEVQRAYWQAFMHIDQFHTSPNRDRHCFLAWLLRIVRNQCLMLIRVQRRTPFVHIDAICGVNQRPMELASSGITADRALVEQEMFEVLRKEIRGIPPILRNVLLLYYVEERPIKDVAEQLQITVPAAKSRLLRARQELRKRVSSTATYTNARTKSLRLPGSHNNALKSLASVPSRSQNAISRLISPH